MYPAQNKGKEENAIDEWLRYQVCWQSRSWSVVVFLERMWSESRIFKFRSYSTLTLLPYLAKTNPGSDDAGCGAVEIRGASPQLQPPTLSRIASHRIAVDATTYLVMPSSQAAPSSGSHILAHFLRPVRGLRSYLVRALISASYPIRGIWYFLRHPEFYPLFVGRLLPLSIISFLVYFLLFTFAFLPQYLFLLIFHGHAGALVNTTVLVLGEGLVIIQGLFEGFFVDECRVDIFDVS